MYFVCLVFYTLITFFLHVFFFFNDTATTEIYTSDTLFPYTTLFRSRVSARQTGWRPPGQSPGRSGIPSVAGYVPAAHFVTRSEEHTSELQSLMRISYAVFCLKKKKTNNKVEDITETHKIQK